VSPAKRALFQDAEWLDEPELGEMTEVIDNVVRDYRPLYEPDFFSKSGAEKVRISQSQSRIYMDPGKHARLHSMFAHTSYALAKFYCKDMTKPNDVALTSPLHLIMSNRSYTRTLRSSTSPARQRRPSSSTATILKFWSVITKR
jgi:hypothetical protein